MSSWLKTNIKKLCFSSNFLLFRNQVILESSPDYSDSTKYVYDELIKRGLNKRLKIIWVLSGEKRKYDHEHNVLFVSRSSLRAKIAHYTSAYIIDSNQYVRKVRKGQFRIHLTHGMALKMATDYSREAGPIDCMTVSSDYFIKPHSTLYSMPKKNIAVTGMPRNDGFYNDVHVVGKERGRKYIIWMPTYRNHHNIESIQTGIHFRFGIPLVDNESDLKIIDNKLRSTNTTLVIRFHPAEDISNFKKLSLGNIELYDDSIFAKSGLQLYDALKDSDALITDYSSVYYDYLHAHKPIGLAAPDFKSYSKTYDLVTNNYRGDIRGYHLDTLGDLLNFINDVASGTNRHAKDNEWALKRYQKFRDGRSSARVVDLLIKKINGGKKR